MVLVGNQNVTYSTGTKFVPNFPASSPYVTAVGGTTTDGFFELGDEVSINRLFEWILKAMYR